MSKEDFKIKKQPIKKKNPDKKRIEIYLDMLLKKSFIC